MAQNWNKRGGHIKPETGNISFLFNAMHKNVILLETYLSDRIILQVENLRRNVPFKTYPNPAYKPAAVHLEVCMVIVY